MLNAYDQCQDHLQWGEVSDTQPNGYYTIHLGAQLNFTVSTGIDLKVLYL